MGRIGRSTAGAASPGEHSREDVAPLWWRVELKSLNDGK